LCTSPEFLERHGPIDTIDDLIRVPCITQSNALSGWKFITADGPRTIDVQGRMRTNTILAARDAALAGVGVALTPCWMVKNEIESGKLIRVLPDTQMAPVDVYGLVHHAARGSQTLRAVLDYVGQGLSSRISLPSKYEKPLPARN
jgi:DNA-binding transcriptional LysR family regulator